MGCTCSYATLKFLQMQKHIYTCEVHVWHWWVKALPSLRFCCRKFPREIGTSGIRAGLCGILRWRRCQSRTCRVPKCFRQRLSWVHWCIPGARTVLFWPFSFSKNQKKRQQTIFHEGGGALENIHWPRQPNLLRSFLFCHLMRVSNAVQKGHTNVFLWRCRTKTVEEKFDSCMWFLSSIQCDHNCWLNTTYFAPSSWKSISILLTLCWADSVTQCYCHHVSSEEETIGIRVVGTRTRKFMIYNLGLKSRENVSCSRWSNVSGHLDLWHSKRHDDSSRAKELTSLGKKARLFTKWITAYGWFVQKLQMTTQ